MAVPIPGRCRSLAADLRLTALLERAEPRVLDIPEPYCGVLDEAAGWRVQLRT